MQAYLKNCSLNKVTNFNLTKLHDMTINTGPFKLGHDWCVCDQKKMFTTT